MDTNEKDVKVAESVPAIVKDVVPPAAAAEEEEMSQFGSWKFKIRLFRVDQPLWLPKGSVRALMALLIVSVALYCALHSIEMSEFFKTLVATVTALYFTSRLNFSDGEEKEEKKKKKIEEER